MKVSNNFSSEEFRCRCGNCEHSQGFVPPVGLLMALEDIRYFTQAVVTITSGIRCKDHNHNIGGSKYSKHLEGIAADIQIASMTPQDVFSYMESRNYADLLGLGSYNTFTHIDVRGSKARW